MAVNATNNEIKTDMKCNETELEDKEVDEIMGNNKDEVSVKIVSEANELVNVVLAQNSIDDTERETISNIFSEKEIIESKNIVECATTSEAAVKAADEQSESVDLPIKTESAMKVVENMKSKTEFAQTDQEKVPGCEISRNKLRNRNRNTKKGSKLPLKSDFNPEVEISGSDDKIASQNDFPAEIKKSYSSVIKANLVKASNNNNSISSQTKVETAPVSSPLPTNLSCPAIQKRTEQEPDNWEKVPLSISKPDNWEKTSMKRKHKKKSIKFQDSQLPEEIPELEVVAPFKKSLTPVEDVAPFKKSVTPVEVENTVPEENLVDDEIEQEKKKLRRRKKKYGSEEPEESNGGHRVVICDEQISIRYSQAVRSASEVLSPSLLDTVKTSGYCDFLMVNELGLGISRGCMGLGRLYQGKYVPPERIDGLLPELEETECMEEEASCEDVFVEDSCITDSTDIDLD
eukprot:GFUD01007899.1.p1 GENE.GFUD01007899.1~~GFUD01007899.1.p1  ORF type:complete len:505 (-),score=182.65 GFUD01007899.1:972-2351(-)